MMNEIYLSLSLYEIIANWFLNSAHKAALVHFDAAVGSGKSGIAHVGLGLFWVWVVYF